MPLDVFREASRAIDNDASSSSSELRKMKRRRKIVREDMEEEKESTGSYATPHVDLLLDKFAIATKERIVSSGSNKSASKKLHRRDFRANVLERYCASRPESEEAYCHITQDWAAAKTIRVARIVPQCLGTTNLAHLLGTEEVDLNDPRNVLVQLLIFIHHNASKQVPLGMAGQFIFRVSLLFNMLRISATDPYSFSALCDLQRCTCTSDSLRTL